MYSHVGDVRGGVRYVLTNLGVARLFLGTDLRAKPAAQGQHRLLLAPHQGLTLVHFSAQT
jgi:hypothetical protein